MSLPLLDLGIVLLYVLGMLYLGLRGWKMSRTSSDYLVAGRRLGYALFTGCLAAVVLGGASTIGGTKLGYEHGISGMWMVFMIGLGVIGLGAFLSTRLGKLGILSVSEMLELRYNEHVRLASAVVMSSYAGMIAVIQVIAIGTILTAILGWSLATGMLLGGLVLLTYTFLGGMWSVSLTDFIQFVLMTAGIFFVMLPAAVGAAGGWPALESGLPSAHRDLTAIGYDAILAFFLLFTLGLLIGQDIWQRVFTARDATVARRGTILAGLYCLAYAVATALIGMAARVIFPDLADPQMSFARVAVDVLPSGARGFILVATLSALMSTASGALLASSTLLAHDVYRRFLAGAIDDGSFLRRTRWITGAAGLAVIGCALWLQDVLRALDVAYTLLTGSLFAPILAGFFWRRATARATLISMLLSASAAIAAMAFWGIGSTPPILIGLATSAGALIAGSLLTRPTSLDQLTRWEERMAGVAYELRSKSAEIEIR